jgi:hypothetical protein
VKLVLINVLESEHIGHFKVTFLCLHIRHFQSVQGPLKEALSQLDHGLYFVVISELSLTVGCFRQLHKIVHVTVTEKIDLVSHISKGIRYIKGAENSMLNIWTKQG